MGEAIRVGVDSKACARSGFCEKIAPELFRLDEEGVARVIREDVPPELEDAAREAYDACPTNAIVVTE